MITSCCLSVSVSMSLTVILPFVLEIFGVIGLAVLSTLCSLYINVLH